jgi:putative ABC transport system substrate-binding protein
MIGTPDPAANGLVTNLARPEGNVTGVAWFGVHSKQMELLKEIVPRVRRVAYIADPSDRPPPPELSKVGKEYVTSAASTPGFTWQYFPPALGNDYDEIFSRLAADHFDAVLVPSIPANSQNATRIIQLALRHRIPAVGDQADWANGGLLLSYGHDLLWGVRRAAEYVDKILRGAKPGELPVEQPPIELVINLNTAKALGLTVPSSLIARADEVIE